ncbi:hypothetical protein B0F90DRAFT_216601 [Multifurca ochricompacta]|uniref:C2H2-type domain-containing protein n=1 Tax=Multifurca ochricompacta TaxID=376703 RepID=A0AAD4QPE2_9AGAM|nr:hypothetical protein B0F90DRAFT_216601 [Multifurca ochricompacta]
MFHVPSDATADGLSNLSANNDSTSLNLTIPAPPSRTSSPSSRAISPCSVTCPTISSVKTCRSPSLDSEKLQTPTFALPDPAYRDSRALAPIAGDESSSKRSLYSQMSALDARSYQEPTLPLVHETELNDLRWSTGVPRHMMDVFRANPFATIDLSRTTHTPLPSLDSSADADGAKHKIGDSPRAGAAAKRMLSPKTVEPRRKSRAKRARIQSPPVVPFPATGPQQMFAYEFRLDIPYGNTDVTYAEDGSWPRPTGEHEHLFAPRPTSAYLPGCPSMRLPMDREDLVLPLPSRLSYPYTHMTPTPQNEGSEPRIQVTYHSMFPFVSLSTETSSFLVSSSAKPGIDESWPRMEEHRHNSHSLRSTMPVEVIAENTQTYRSSTMPVTLSMQKPLYACPLCPRDFQLPNGLALHLKWHDRVAGSAKNPAQCRDRSLNRVAPKTLVPRTESGSLDTHGIGLTTEGNSQVDITPIFPPFSYMPLQGAGPAPAESIMVSSRGQYINSLPYEPQPQECALFHDALQLNHHGGFSLESNAYLAPLDGLSVLQPLPFEQHRSTSGGLCIVPPA